MDLYDIKRGLRAEIKKRENEQYLTFQCNVRQMCKDVLAKLEEQESVIAELKRQIEFLKTTHDSCGNCNKCADGMGKVFDETLNELKAKAKGEM